jgi:large subunit ribosomal protein L21
MLAVIKTGGKQYLVSPGDKIQIEKIDREEGKEIEFSEVLLVEKRGKIKIGNPFVKGAKVIGKMIRHGKGKKILVLTYTRRKRYRVNSRHRQQFTEVEILKIEY